MGLRTKFSITIPAYKRRYLKEAIDSCLSQTYQNFELVIVNDASPEDLDSIVSSYSDKRIRYYKNEKNCGAVNVVDNWNKCLEYAKGEYIICMGDDDRLLPNCLEEYVKLMEKYPSLGVYHAWTEIIDEKGEYKNMTDARPEYESVYSLIWHRWKGRSQYIGDFLFEVQLLRNNGGFFKLPLAWASDDISAIIAAKERGIANTQKVCFHYRVNSQTISNAGNVICKLHAIEKEQKWYEKFLKNEPDNELDKKYWACLKRMQFNFFEKKRGNTIAKDLKDNSMFRIIYYFIHRKEFHLTTKSLLYSIYRSSH